ncbi:MAG: hypothetical protein SFZ23_08025 [Planctomycetota bacterium]|nr:hypothetical protein [Planctomycetota bacterium]
MTMCLAGVANAQTGTIDQRSPHDPSNPLAATFEAGETGFTWQQQIRPARSGRLEGIRITYGDALPGTRLAVRVRAGSGPSVAPPLFQTTLTFPGGANFARDTYLDMRSANIQLFAGVPFVLEFQGFGAHLVVVGSFVEQGPPLYAEPLFLNGAEFDPRWRIGFDTFMEGGSVCVADFNRDGQSDFFDYLDFAAAFAADDPAADINLDGQVDFFDYLDFASAFDQGCG